MSGIIQILLISVSLAMDAVSVSIAGGTKAQNSKLAHAFKVAAFFGVFQAIMPIIGWAMGEALQGFISTINYWIAFTLLGAIGIKMIHEALQDEPTEKRNILDTKTLFVLAIATSIDALVVGVTLNVLQVPFVVSILTIGVVTFILSFVGFLFGKQLGVVFGKKIEIFGGLVLIALGIKILFDHILHFPF
jgi:putative Mn2+ efflux pump MntP